MWNARMDDSQAGIKIAGRNSNNLRYIDSITAVVESEEELKESLYQSEKEGLELNIQKSKMTASGPITSWQMDGENSRNSDRFYFLGLQNHWGQRLQPQN